MLPTASLTDFHTERVYTPVPEADRIMTWARLKPWWLRPAVWTKPGSIPNETQFLLFRKASDRFAAILPVAHGNIRAYCKGTENGLIFCVDGTPTEDTPRNLPVAVLVEADHPLEAARAAVAVAARELKTFRLREDKAVPPWVDFLGWCTWDAFYKDVRHDRVLRGLRAIHKAGFQPRFLLLDDGWQQVNDNGEMISFQTEPTKFPDGLAPTVRAAKERFGVEWFGLWHALEGYWRGVDPKGPLAKTYRVIRNRHAVRPANGSPHEEDVALIHPDDAYRFYHDWYRRLRADGIDMVKADVQSSLAFFTHGKLPDVDTMRAYQEAQQGAAAAHFGGNSLHCMSHGNDVLFHLSSAQVLRNSDDFFPARPETHAAHLVINAFNSVWTACFGLPDWDMFQSDHAHAEYHAVARAISGGPCYVSDKPGRHNTALLHQLCDSQGRLLRCDQPAQPAGASLFVDFAVEDRLLKVVNRNGPIGLMGLFHVRWDADPDQRIAIEDVLAADEIPGLEDENYILFFPRSGVCRPTTRTQRHAIDLPPMGCELAVFSPVLDGVAPLGLLGKFNGSRALEAYGFEGPDRFVTLLEDGGPIGFWCAHKPSQVLVNGRATRAWKRDRSGLLRVDTPAGGPVEMDLIFARGGR